MSDESETASHTESPSGDSHIRPRRLLAEIVQSMRPMLKSVARQHAQSVPDCKEDESDIVQRSIVKAIERADQFEGRTTGQWRAWLVAIVRNQARDVRRYWSQECRAHLLEEAESHVVSGLVDQGANSPGKTLDDAESRQRLDAAIASLSIQDQQLVHWRIIHFVTYREIALRLKITETAARRRCETVLAALREALNREDVS
jgi:RNA polymerase sigma-70 factor (ECF subfamily)